MLLDMQLFCILVYDSIFKEICFVCEVWGLILLQDMSTFKCV